MVRKGIGGELSGVSSDNGLSFPRMTMTALIYVSLARTEPFVHRSIAGLAASDCIAVFGPMMMSAVARTTVLGWVAQGGQGAFLCVS